MNSLLTPQIIWCITNYLIVWTPQSKISHIEQGYVLVKLNLEVASKLLGMGKIRHPSFYIYLHIEDNIVHNYLIGLLYSTNVTPKSIVDVMHLECTRNSNGLL